MHFPDNFDTDYFDDEALVYLNDYLKWYRKDICQSLLEFLIKPTKSLKNNSERSRYAVMMRIFCRLTLLYKIICDPENSAWAELPERYGVSNHNLYDERKRVVEELSANDKNVAFYICNNRKK
jgi:hypothetical protein